MSEMAIDVLAKDDQWEIEATSTPEGDPVFYYVVPHNDKRFVAAPLHDFAIIWSDSETDEQRIGISDAVPKIYRGFYAAHEALCSESCRDAESKLLNHLIESGASDNFVNTLMLTRSRFFRSMAESVDGQDSTLTDSLRDGDAFYTELMVLDAYDWTDYLAREAE